MFFILSKILFFLIKPYFWFFGLLIFSFFIKNKKRRKRLRIGVLIGIYIFSNSFFFDECMRAWEIKALPEKCVNNYDYAIVLGGMMTYDPELQRINFNSGIDRLLQTIDLYKKEKVKKIIITGGSGSIIDKELTEADKLYNYLIRIGIPSEDLFFEAASKNTRENAVNVKQNFGNKISNSRILLVTSAYHLRRAEACFSKVGIKTTGFATNRFAGKRKFFIDHLFLPSAETITAWEYLIKEIVGYAVYKIRGFA